MIKPLSRRAVLRGAGGVAIGLPFLHSMLRPGQSAASTGTIPRRVIFFFSSCGIVPDTWWPSGGENDFVLPYALEPLEPFRAKLIIPDGIRMATAIENAGGSNGHDNGTGHCLVARALRPGPSGVGEFGHLWDGSAGGISIDQHIANHCGDETSFRSLEFGVKAEGIRQAVPSRISYRDAFEPVTPMHTAGAAFDRIFAPLGGDEAARTALRRRRELVLDRVRGDLNRLRPRLPADDRRRVDAHLASIADIESRLTSLNPGIACTLPTRDDETDFPALGRLQLDLMAKAMECDLTRVASIQWSTGQSSTRFTWLGTNDSHHGLSHRGLSDTAAKNQVSEIDRWYAEQFAYLLGRLDAVDAGDGQTLLDHTTVVWVNEQMQGIGNIHRFERMPFILAGSCGGALRTGRLVTFDRAPHGDLYVSLLQAMGINETTFGDPEYCNGPLSGLT